jgi:hypothetical protein
MLCILRYVIQVVRVTFNKPAFFSGADYVCHLFITLFCSLIFHRSIHAAEFRICVYEPHNAHISASWWSKFSTGIELWMSLVWAHEWERQAEKNTALVVYNLCMKYLRIWIGLRMSCRMWQMTQSSSWNRILLDLTDNDRSLYGIFLLLRLFQADFD